MSFSSIWDLIKKGFSEWSEDKASRLAASLAYYTAMSMAPLLVLAVMVLGWLNLNGQRAVESQMGMLVGPTGVQAADMMIHAAKNQSGVFATIVSLIILIFGASGVFAELQDSMNTVWEVQPKPDLSWWDLIKARFFSLALVFGTIFILMVSLFVSTALNALITTVAGNGKIVGFILDVILSLAVYTGIFLLLFKYLPDVKIGFADVWRGGIATAILFTIGKYLLTLYLTRGSTTSPYGAAGAFAALLIWVYYSAQILFFGAELTQVYAKKYGSRVMPAEHAVPVTEETRAQQGLVRQHDLQTAAKASEQLSDQRGAVYGKKSLVPKRQIVTIERPRVGATRALLIAGAGLLGGAAIAAAGWWRTDHNERGELISHHLKKRLDAVDLNKRLDAIDARLRATIEREEHWWNRLADSAKSALTSHTKSSAGWFSHLVGR